jgi:hypothetical protein
VAIQFEEFLAKQRNEPIRFNRVRARNPFADEFAQDLNQHLETVEYWVNGAMDATKMMDAMQFFHDAFGSLYEPAEGRKLYRGQTSLVFDGSPRSYSYDRQVAEAFAEECGWFAKCRNFLIERKVCSHHCADHSAFRWALDLGKLMRAYASHPYAAEREVILLNTRPKGMARVFELTPA